MDPLLEHENPVMMLRLHDAALRIGPVLIDSTALAEAASVAMDKGLYSDALLELYQSKSEDIVNCGKALSRALIELGCVPPTLDQAAWLLVARLVERLTNEESDALMLLQLLGYVVINQ